MMLGACGGGGSVNSPGTTPVVTPTPSPTPAPTPTPTPAPTAEDAKSAAAVGMKADYAYARGITGKGVTIAIVDTGIDRDGPEFAGRISADSTGFDQKVARCATCPGETIRFELDDKDGHGSKTAAVAAGARDGNGMHGVAYDATILALKISGPNLEGITAGSTGPIPESDAPNVALIAPAIRYAVDKGAFVISMSINGSGGGEQMAADLKSAMDLVRGGNRLFVESVTNSVGEDSFSGKVAENLVGKDLSNKDWFLFGIRVDANLQPPSGNGTPGALADRTLSVVASNVATVDQNGQQVVVTGNSFAAPGIAGAAALLKQYWPQLGGKEISRIMLDTATDLGAPGVDQVYGVGLLNVEKAMQAQAPAMSFAAARTVLTRYSSLVVSAPFGGAAGAADLGSRTSTMTVFDRYGRDYLMTAPSSIRARSSGLLAGGLAASASACPLRSSSWSDAKLGIVTTTTTGPWQAAASGRPAMVTFSPAAGQTVTLGANVAVGPGGGSLLAGSYLRGTIGQPIGMSSEWSIGGWSASFASGSSIAASPSSFRRGSRSREAGLRTVAIFTPFGVGLEVSELVERGQVLGLRDDAGAGAADARTLLATTTLRRNFAGMQLSGRATVGSSSAADAVAGVRFDGRIISIAFAVEGARPLFGGLATLGLSSPLRVERARASLLVPVAYDLMSGALAEKRRTFDLSPAARELDLELGWSTALASTSTLRLGVARAFDAGHVRGASDVAAFFNLVVR